MIRKTRGIVLHTTRYGESSLVVHCYTEQYGRQSYMIKGIRKSRKQNRSNLFQPLFILDFEIYHKDSREIQLVKEEETNPMLAHFLINTIQYLDALEQPSPDFHIVFLFQLSRYLGFYPQNNYGEENGLFNLNSGIFKSSMADPEVQLNREDSLLWSRYMLLDFQSIKKVDFNSTQRLTMLNNLIRYFKSHVEGMGDIRSLEVLHSFFHN